MSMKLTIRSQQGFGLVEILVSMLIIAVGLLGTIALQMRAMQTELESYQRIQAMILLDDMVDRLKANPGWPNLVIAENCYNLDGAYDFSPAVAGTGSVLPANQAALNACMPDDPRAAIAANDLLAWDANLRGANVVDASNTSVGAMIGARGCIELLGDRMYRVSVAWQGMHPTVAPMAALTCGAGLYGDEEQRRVVSRVVSFAVLN